MDKQALISGMLDAFARAVSEALSENGPEEIHLTGAYARLDTRETTPKYRHGGPADSARIRANCFIGAPDETRETWPRRSLDDTGENAFALVSRCFAKAVAERFESALPHRDAGSSGAPLKTGLSFNGGPLSRGPMAHACCVLSPEFEALDSGLETAKSVAPVRADFEWHETSDMLMHVKVPVSVSLAVLRSV
jgi:hypothetical protein